MENLGTQKKILAASLLEAQKNYPLLILDIDENYIGKIKRGSSPRGEDPCSANTEVIGIEDCIEKLNEISKEETVHFQNR